MVDGLWPAALVEQAAREARILHPRETLAAATAPIFTPAPWLPPAEMDPDTLRPRPGTGSFGSGCPAPPDMALNHMSVHPRALAACAQLMGTPTVDIRLSQSEVGGKSGRLLRPEAQEGDDHYGELIGDQQIHVD